MPGFQIGKYFHCPDSAAAEGKGPLPYEAYSSPTHTVETVRKHRFLLKMMGISPTDSNGYNSGSGSDSDYLLKPVFGMGTNDIMLFAHKCARPSPEVDEITIHHGQNEIYRPGKHRWKPLDITFYEVLDTVTDDDGAIILQSNRTAKLIYKWWAQTMILSGLRHNKPSKYLAHGLLRMLDGFGNTVWEYRLYDCWPMKVTPTDADFSDSNIADITLTLRFQKAVETQGLYYPKTSKLL